MTVCYKGAAEALCYRNQVGLSANVLTITTHYHLTPRCVHFTVRSIVQLHCGTEVPVQCPVVTPHPHRSFTMQHKHARCCTLHHVDVVCMIALMLALYMAMQPHGTISAQLLPPSNSI